MDDNTLFEVYVDTLKDMWSANEQMRDIVTEMAETAGDPELGRRLHGLAARLEDHNRTVRDLLARHGEEEEPDKSRAMQGLTTQAREEGLEKPLTEAARDVVIVAQVQRMAHYGIAGYGTARAMAEALGLAADAGTLSADLDDVYATDELLTHLAESVLNPASADEEDDEDEEEESGLRNGTDEVRNGYDTDFEEDDDDDEDEGEDGGRLK